MKQYFFPELGAVGVVGIDGTVGFGMQNSEISVFFGGPPVAAPAVALAAAPVAAADFGLVWVEKLTVAEPP